jgi:hypothetical protein
MSQAQKWDAIWQFGHSIPVGDSVIYHTRMDFNYDPVKVTGVSPPVGSFAGSVVNMCDSTGKLQFYSDKCRVTGASGLPPMAGGEVFWNEKFDSAYCYSGSPLGQQSILALPLPDSAGQYLIFDYGFGPIDVTIQPLKLYEARVDMRANNGQGAVVEKFKISILDTLGGGYLTAVRHANGRDWWILVPKYLTNEYYTCLLKPDGFHVMYKQASGIKWGVYDHQGQATFSPDGSVYARMHCKFGLSIFDFDRCTGRLSNPRNMLVDTVQATGGVAISANSRFLYATTTTKLWQFDLKSSDVASSKMLIDTYSGDASLEYGVFYLSYLAPDNKIYIAGISSHRYLSVINRPDSLGLACDFTQHSIHLPSYNFVGLPNYPYFRLGKSAVVCDSTKVGVETLPGFTIDRIALNPNPAYDRVEIQYQGSADLELKVYDIRGTLMCQGHVSGFSTEMDVSSWKPGVYFLYFSNSNGRVAKKLVKI